MNLEMLKRKASRKLTMVYGLVNVPKSWFREHVQKADDCGCNLEGPSKRCDVGEALFRLKVQEETAHKKKET